MRFLQWLLTKMRFLHLNRHMQGLLALTTVTVLWGSTYAVVRDAVSKIAPSTLVFGRFALASLLFLPLWHRDWQLNRRGAELSIWLLMTHAMQSIALESTTANRCAFILSVNVVLVPLFLAFWGHRLHWYNWCGAVLAFIGVGLLAHEGTSLCEGDVWAFFSGISYAIYVIRLDVAARHYPSLPLTAVQLASAALLAGGWMWVADDGNWISAGGEFPWNSLLYLAVATTALAAWMQVWGQRYVKPSEAAVIYTLEPVWAAVFGYIFLDERLRFTGFVGAGCIAIAILLACLPTLLISPRHA